MSKKSAASKFDPEGEVKALDVLAKLTIQIRLLKASRKKQPQSDILDEKIRDLETQHAELSTMLGMIGTNLSSVNARAKKIEKQVRADMKSSRAIAEAGINTRSAERRLNIKRDNSVVERLANDFEFFARQCLPIKYRPGMNPDHPLGGSGPMILTRSQKIVINHFIKVLIYDERPLRAQILKTRQLGCTTLLLAFAVWLMQKIPNYQVMIIIDKDDHAATKRNMVVNWIEFFTKKFKGMHGIKSGGKHTKMLILTNESTMYFESAMSTNPGTSEFINLLITSEMPKWPAGRPVTVKNSVVPAIPFAPYTAWINESTAHGMEDFYRDWIRNTTDPKSKTLAIFLPWYHSEEYTLKPTDDDFDSSGNFIYSEDKDFYDFDDETGIEISERAYANKYNLEPKQVLYRRNKINIDFGGDRSGFDQEYPTTPSHAYRASGNPYFPSKVLAYIKATQCPAARYTIRDAHGWTDHTQVVSADSVKPAVRPDKNGSLFIRDLPQAGQRYFCGTDTAEGKTVVDERGKDDPDWTVFSMKDERGYTVAMMIFRALPEESWIDLLLFSKFYNNAMVDGDRINAGSTLLSYFWNTGYRNIWIAPKPKGRRPRDRAWLVLNKQSRTELLLNYRAACSSVPQRVFSFSNHDETPALELSSFIINPSTGKIEAAPGHHDDIVFAEAIAEGLRAKVLGESKIRKENVEAIRERQKKSAPVKSGFTLSDTTLFGDKALSTMFATEM